MNERLVKCKKLEKELPGLEKAPFDDELGQDIYNNISAEAWKLWNDDLMIKIINEYRLNLAEEEHFGVLIKQMKAFLNLEEGSGEAVLEVENAERGK